MPQDPTPRSRRIFLAVGYTLAGVGMLTFGARALQMVLSGQGHETYRTPWGMLVHYTSVVVLFGALAVALLGAAIYRIYTKRK